MMSPRQLELLDPALFKELQSFISKHPPKISNTRKNSGTGRTQAYGIINRFKGGLGIGLGMNCEKFPNIWEEGIQLSQKICPDDLNWTTFMLNMNYEAVPHIDKNNVGESLVVAFGDYKGGELVVINSDGSETEYNIRYKPVIMDASQIVHYVKPITEGTRFSVVFFRTKMTKAFYNRYGNDFTLNDMINLIPLKEPGQKNSQVRIPI